MNGRTVVNLSPRLSIVIPIRRAADTIADTLDSLLPQCRNLDVEIVLAVCESDASLAAIANRTGPQCRVVVAPSARHIPALRRDAILEARGDWVVITEDHCVFPAGWVANVINNLGGSTRLIRGGPVSNGDRTLLGWALYFNRYIAFLPPVSDGPAAALPGNSACYPREALMARTELWQDGFWEFEVNEALKRANFTLWLSPALAVSQNQSRGFWEYLQLRYRHGRLYGARRLRSMHAGARLLAALRAPLIPWLLQARALRAVIHKRAFLPHYIAVVPLLFVYQCAWALGEGTGSLAGFSGQCIETD